MKKVSPGKILLFHAVCAFFIISCDRDDSIDRDSPSWHIAQSEKLTIPAEVDLPANLPNGNTRAVTHYAVGVQKYKAQAKANTQPVVYEWVFVAPRAHLYDQSNALVGSHSAGPTWQLFGVTDSIYAQHFMPVRSAPGPQAGSIDWLLLMPKTGKTPTGIFANVSYIQRIATTGGKAPATAPTAPTDTVDVPYTAVYRFSKKNP
jgi:hypothetical protein